MLDLIDCWILLIVGCTALGVFGLLCAVAAMILTRREAARRDKLVAVSEVSRDWQPTGRINAVTDAWVMESEKDDIPSNFVFRIEENRLVRDIGGGEVMEIRWRPPARAEVSEIQEVGFVGHRFMRACISMTSTMEVSSTTNRSQSSGLSSPRLKPPPLPQVLDLSCRRSIRNASPVSK
jgi:hypothetical protein